MIDPQQLVGVPLNRFGNSGSVERAEKQTAQDQKIHRSLQEFDSVGGFWRHSRSTTIIDNLLMSNCGVGPCWPIYFLVTPPAGFLMFSLKEFSSIGAKMISRSSPLGVPFGWSLNIFLSLTQAFVYVFGSSNFTVSSRLSRSRRCQRSSTRKSSLNGD